MATRNRRQSNHSTATDDVLDLEALRKDDSSWHPCRVSLSSSGVELIVSYGNADSEEIIVSEEEAIARLRIRSIPLVGDDCVHIQEGDHVLATQKSQSQSLFFDAEVEKALRVRHSKKVHCRCIFVIKWLHQVLKGGTLTVSSSSVMKLAAKSINEHPIVSAFLGMLVKNMDCSSPSPTILADMDSDIDINELLEKQITIISSLADMSKKKGSDNIVFRAEVDCKEQNPRRATAVSKLSKSHVQASPDHNHLKRATRSTKKLQTEMEVKDRSPPAPSIQEQQSEIRSPLNPLAARAAFASLMSKMSQIATSVPFDPETKKDANSLISTISASGKSQLMVMGAPSVKLAKERETETNTLEIPDSRGRFACSVVKSKLSQPPKVTRLTRSAIKEGDGIPDDSCVEQKSQPSIGPRRFTRSAVCKAKEPETVEAKQRAEEYKPRKHSGGDCSEHNIAALKSHAFEDEKLVTSRNVSAVELFPTQDRSCLMKKEDGNKTHEVVRNGSRNSTSRSRFTRSAGHEENGNKLVTATQGLEEDKLAHNTKLNSCKGNVTSTKSSVLETTIWSSSPVDAEGDLSRIEDKHNVRKMSSALQATEKTEGCPNVLKIWCITVFFYVKLHVFDLDIYHANYLYLLHDLCSLSHFQFNGSNNQESSPVTIGHATSRITYVDFQCGR